MEETISSSLIRCVLKHCYDCWLDPIELSNGQKLCRKHFVRTYLSLSMQNLLTDTKVHYFLNQREKDTTSISRFESSDHQLIRIVAEITTFIKGYNVAKALFKDPLQHFFDWFIEKAVFEYNQTIGSMHSRLNKTNDIVYRDIIDRAIQQERQALVDKINQKLASVQQDCFQNLEKINYKKFEDIEEWIFSHLIDCLYPEFLQSWDPTSDLININNQMLETIRQYMVYMVI